MKRVKPLTGSRSVTSEFSTLRATSVSSWPGEAPGGAKPVAVSEKANGASLRQRFELFGGQARCRARNAHRAHQPPVHAKHRRRHRGHALFALANRPVVALFADLFIGLARLARKRQDHTARRSFVQRQAFAHACVVAQRLRAFHAHQAGPHIAFAHIKRGAFARGKGQLAQRGLQHVLHVKTGLVARAQPACSRAQAPVAVLALHHEARLRQRARQAQHRGLVQAAAAAQLGQGQAGFAQCKGFQHLQGTCDGDDTTTGFCICRSHGTGRGGEGLGGLGGVVAHGAIRFMVRNCIVWVETSAYSRTHGAGPEHGSQQRPCRPA